MSNRALIALLLISAMGACRQAPEQPRFPKADRPVAPIVGDSFSTEDARDRVGEAEQVIQLAGVVPGMSVADIGAGEGYYTVRLAPVVGRRGRVLAEDIVPEIEDRLVQRVHRESLDNVAVKLGEPDDPKLPPHSFDRIFMVHMYHEIDEPYEFLWNLRPALAPEGLVVVVDADRPTQAHGTPSALLDCEFKQVGYKLVERKPMPQAGGYLALFKAEGPRPEPRSMHACKG